MSLLYEYGTGCGGGPTHYSYVQAAKQPLTESADYIKLDVGRLAPSMERVPRSSTQGGSWNYWAPIPKVDYSKFRYDCPSPNEEGRHA